MHDKESEELKRVGLIGGGIWGKNILRDLVAMEAVVEVWEPDESQHTALQEMGAANVWRGLPTADNALDGIIVASPSTTHRAVLEQIMPLNLPIFVEKPLTTNLEDAEALAETVHDRVFLMHIWRYHPGVLQLGELARTQVLGKVLGVRSTRANWTSPRRDTDSAWNLLPHDLTIALAILGHIPVPRTAVVERHAGVTRGMVALLGMDPWLTVEVSNRYERKIREIRLHCEHGVAILKDEKVDYLTVLHGDADTPLGESREEKIPFFGPSPLQSELREFLDYLGGGPSPRCDFAEGLLVVRVLDELMRLAG
jgi:predicted dehydrogenase